MTQIDKADNIELLEKSIRYLEHKGFEDIKVDMEGYEKPKSYLQKSSSISLTPDITAFRAGTMHYFEISVKSEEPTLLKTKWRFLDVLTRMKDQRFKIITARGHYKFTNDMLNDLNLEKTPIKL